jgi:hypothetical protein
LKCLIKYILNCFVLDFCLVVDFADTFPALGPTACLC